MSAKIVEMPAVTQARVFDEGLKRETVDFLNSLIQDIERGEIEHVSMCILRADGRVGMMSDSLSDKHDNLSVLGSLKLLETWYIENYINDPV